MKKLFLIIPLLLITFVINGQDLIFCKNGKSINCSVTDADSSKIYFNTNLDGYVIKRSIARSEIKAVQFGNDSEIEPIRERQQAKEIQPAQEMQPAVEVKPVTDKERNTAGNYIKKETKTYFKLGFTLPGFKGNTRDFADYLAYSSGDAFDFKRCPRLFPITFGAGIDVTLTSSLSFRGGLEFVPKGVKFLGDYNDDDGNYKMYVTIKVNYIELPLSVKFSPVEWQWSDGTSYYLLGGLAPAYKVVSKLRYKISGGDSQENDSETNDFDGSGETDLCHFIGFGIEKGNSFALEFKYEQGLINVIDADDSGFVFYNNSLSFSFILKI
jgi:hypothetical protein